MPSIVSFNEKLAFSRRPRDDEVYVMCRFAHHARHCAYCAQPLVHVAQGRNLCAQGARHANMVRQYIYSKGGKLYSLVDYEQGETMQIEIPSDCEVIRDLMFAVGRGLRTQPQKARTVVVHNPVTRPQQAPLRRSATTNTAVVEIAPSGRTYRGSLYVVDMMDRRRHSPREYRP
jgi:hypothetical protein